MVYRGDNETPDSKKKKRKSNDQLRDTTDNAFDPVVTGVTEHFFSTFC
jgi:hypothetical protein